MCGRRLESDSFDARKLVTVLFADLEGSTQLGERLDPEALRDLLRTFFEAMSEVIADWGGTVSKYIGDAIVAVFGYPFAREDDPIRALHAGLAMQGRLSELNADGSGLDVPLAMRIAVNTGEIVVSDDPDSLLVGDVFNIASRLEGLAPATSVIASDRTRRAAEAGFVFEDLGLHPVKGKSEEVRAWRVIEPLQGPPGEELPFVGREGELAILDTVASQAVEEERPRLVLVVGEPGIGKSRLIKEFGMRAGDRFRVLTGRCLPYGQGITFWPLREILWDLASVSLEDDAAATHRKLTSFVQDLPADVVVDRPWLVHALAMTAGMRLEDNPLDSLSPESANEELRLAWPTLASAISAERPALIAIEDLHWAEDPLLDMLEQIALRAIGPCVVMGTARKEFSNQRPGWAARAIPSQISLGPLTRKPLGMLVDELVPSIDEAQKSRIVEATNGNPFFTVEMSRQIRDSPESSLDLPDTIRGMLAARIDSLDPADRLVLQAAAVVGDVFWPAAIQAISAEVVQTSLQVLEDDGFVTTRPGSLVPQQRQFVFRHGLMREVAYQSIPRRDLGRLHRSTAEWTESTAGGRRDEFIELIAHHYEAAASADRQKPNLEDATDSLEVRQKAYAALLAAGEAARSRFSIEQAIGYARRAKRLAESDMEKLVTLELEAASYHAAAHAHEAWPVYLEAVQLARRLGDEEAISRITTNVTLLWSRYGGTFTNDDWKPEAITLVEERLAEIGEDGDTEEHVALLIGRAVWNRREGVTTPFSDIKADANRALEIAEKTGSTPLLSHALDSYLMERRTEGFCGIVPVADRIAQVAEHYPDRREIHEMIVTASIACGEVGEWDRAERLGLRAYDDAQRMGLHQRIHGLRARTAAMVPRGDFADLDQALSLLADMVTEDGGRMCEFGAGAVAAACLTAFETRSSEAGREMMEFFGQALPDRILHRPQLQLAEYVRPFVSPEETLNLLRSVPNARPAHQIFRLRAQIPLAAMSGDNDLLGRAAEEAEELAAAVCAPLLKSLAVWARAVLSGQADTSWPDLSQLETEAGSYFASRLAIDLMGLGARPPRPELDALRGRLDRMGAHNSLGQLEAVL